MKIQQDFGGNFQVDSKTYVEKQRAQKLLETKQVAEGSHSWIYLVYS